MYSIEYLFQKCNLYHKALGLELAKPILLCGISTSKIVLLKIICSKQEEDQLTINVLNKVDTNYGVYSMSVSDHLGNPYNEQQIDVDIESILSVWIIK